MLNNWGPKFGIDNEFNSESMCDVHLFNPYTGDRFMVSVGCDLLDSLESRQSRKKRIVLILSD